MRFVDLYFFNKYIERNLILYKLELPIDYFIFKKPIPCKLYFPFLKKVFLIFSIIDVNDIDYIWGSNYIYLLKYFFRANISICQYRSKFSLGVWYYSFEIRADFRKIDNFFVLYITMNDIITKIGKDYQIYWYKNQYSVYVKDLSIFLDWNTSVGLFNLGQHDLKINFIFNEGSIYTGVFLISLYKL